MTMPHPDDPRRLTALEIARKFFLMGIGDAKNLPRVNGELTSALHRLVKAIEATGHTEGYATEVELLSALNQARTALKNTQLLSVNKTKIT